MSNLTYVVAVATYLLQPISCIFFLTLLQVAVGCSTISLIFTSLLPKTSHIPSLAVNLATLLTLEMMATGWPDLWTKQCRLSDKINQVPSPDSHQLSSCLAPLSEPGSYYKHQWSCVVCTSSSCITQAHYTSAGLSSALHWNKNMHCWHFSYSMKNPTPRII